MSQSRARGPSALQARPQQGPRVGRGGLWAVWVWREGWLPDSEELGGTRGERGRVLALSLTQPLLYFDSSRGCAPTDADVSRQYHYHVADHDARQQKMRIDTNTNGAFSRSPSMLLV
eukprot:scaffold40265_cov39-Tisochrysis_lutea.AAC.2